MTVKTLFACFGKQHGLLLFNSTPFENPSRNPQMFPATAMAEKAGTEQLQRYKMAYK